MSHGNRGSNGNQGSKWIRPERRLAIYLRDGMLCVYCLIDLSGPGADRTLDHVGAERGPGCNDSENLVTSCRSCNSSRKDKPLRDFTDKETRARIRRNTRRCIRFYLAQAKERVYP